jgi:hypothetical protein
MQCDQPILTRTPRSSSVPPDSPLHQSPDWSYHPPSERPQLQIGTILSMHARKQAASSFQILAKTTYLPLTTIFTFHSAHIPTSQRQRVATVLRVHDVLISNNYVVCTRYLCRHELLSTYSKTMHYTYEILSFTYNKTPVGHEVRNPSGGRVAWLSHIPQHTPCTCLQLHEDYARLHAVSLTSQLSGLVAPATARLLTGARASQRHSASFGPRRVSSAGRGHCMGERPDSGQRQKLGIGPRGTTQARIRFKVLVH